MSPPSFAPSLGAYVQPGLPEGKLRVVRDGRYVVREVVGEPAPGRCVGAAEARAAAAVRGAAAGAVGAAAQGALPEGVGGVRVRRGGIRAQLRRRGVEGRGGLAVVERRRVRVRSPVIL